MTDLLAGVFIPCAAILISTGLAIALAVLERRAARRARDLERQDRVCEDVLESLSFFVSANPFGEEMAPDTRKLRSRVMLLQTLPGVQIRRVGLWIALEVEVALPRFSDAMVNAGPNPDVEQTLAVLAPAHRAFHETVVRLTVWMRGEVKDEAVEERIELLVNGGAKPFAS
jgi:hypothetical protein